MAPRGEEADVEGEGGSAPGAPTNLEVVDWDATTLSLKYVKYFFFSKSWFAIF